MNYPKTEKFVNCPIRNQIIRNSKLPHSLHPLPKGLKRIDQMDRMIFKGHQ